MNKTLLITITTLAAVAVLLMLVILLIMLARTRRTKKGTDRKIMQIPQVQSPIVPVHVTETKNTLDEADASGDILIVFSDSALIQNNNFPLMQPIDNQPHNLDIGRMILNQVSNIIRYILKIFMLN